MKIDLSGKIAFITGGSGQLGRVISRTFAECGAAVAVGYHTGADVAEAVCAGITGAGGTAVPVYVDVADPASVADAREYIESSLGAVDIIVACAVERYERKEIIEQDIADFDSQYRSIILQNVNLAKTFVPPMRERGYGRYIALSTDNSTLCDPGFGAYSSMKRGLDGFIRVLAKEVGLDGVTVNEIAPGWMITDRDRANGTESSENYDPYVPLGHRGEDIDVASAAAFLASELARFITGVYLPVCGGTVM